MPTALVRRIKHPSVKLNILPMKSYLPGLPRDVQIAESTLPTTVGCPYMKSARNVENIRAQKRISYKNSFLAVNAQIFWNISQYPQSIQEYLLSILRALEDYRYQDRCGHLQKMLEGNMRIAALKQKQPENIAQVSLSSNMPTEKSVMIIYCLIIRKKKTY